MVDAQLVVVEEGHDVSKLRSAHRGMERSKKVISHVHTKPRCTQTAQYVQGWKEANFSHVHTRPRCIQAAQCTQGDGKKQKSNHTCIQGHDASKLHNVYAFVCVYTNKDGHEVQVMRNYKEAAERFPRCAYHTGMDRRSRL